VTRTHLITGVAGQDGVLLARLLRDDGDRVVGTVLPGSRDAGQMAPYLSGVEVVELDVRDTEGFGRLVDRVRPCDVYNLAAMSSVARSWEHPEEALEINGEAPARMLEVLARHPDIRFLQAASAEETAAARDSPYAQGKIRARAAVDAARADGRFACAAVLHIHESVLRPRTFVSRKVTRAAAEIALGRAARLTLGRLDVRRDWGAAVDHVRALRLIMDSAEPVDHVVGTGVVHSLRDLVQVAFGTVGIDDPWALVDHDPTLGRPLDAAVIAEAPEPPVQQLGWRPLHTFEATIAQMTRVDVARVRTGVEESADYLDEAAGAAVPLLPT
jgi:GDPmannose 4,6-dehydratase